MTRERETFFVSTQLIEDNVATNRLRAVSFFYALKRTYINGRIYKVGNPIERMASVAGVSTQTIYRWLRTLKTMNLITEDAGAYILASNRQINEKHNIEHPERRRRRDKVIREGESTFKEFESLILFKHFEKAAHKQARAVALTDFIESNKGEGNPQKRTGDTFRVSLSIRTVANLYGCSTTKARRMLREWNASGLIQTTVNKPVARFEGTPKDVNSLLGSGDYLYHKNGIIYGVVPSYHELLRSPVTYFKVTGDVYKRILKKKDAAQMKYIDNQRRKDNAEHYVLSLFS